MIELLAALTIQSAEPATSFADKMRQSAQRSVALSTCARLGYALDFERLRSDHENLRARGRLFGFSDADIDALSTDAMQQAIAGSPANALAEIPNVDPVARWDEVRRRATEACEAIRRDDPDLLTAVDDLP